MRRIIDVSLAGGLAVLAAALPPGARAAELPLTCQRIDCATCSPVAFSFATDRGERYLAFGSEVEVGETFVRRAMVSRDRGDSVELMQWLFDRYNGEMSISFRDVPKSRLPVNSEGRVAQMTFKIIDTATRGIAPHLVHEYRCEKAAPPIRRF